MNVDFHHVEEKHNAIHSALLNWSRWVSVRRGPDGWHGTRLRWKLRKVNELQAIDKTYRALALAVTA